MNNTEAQLILNAYRPGGADVDDPKMIEALEQAGRDPSLGDWFKQSREFDESIARRLANVAPPAGLRENILAGARVQAPVRWTRRIWAMAAALALLLGVGIVWITAIEQPRTAGWQHAALDWLAGTVVLDHESRDPRELKAWLHEHGAPIPESLPARLAALDGVGCKTLAWSGRTVSIMCFALDTGALVHLVVIDRDALSDAPPGGSPRHAMVDGWNTATWSTENRTMMLVTNAPSEELKQLL